jgi:hypothetical protein
MDRLETFQRVGGRTRSQHLGGDLDGEVLVNEDATAYPNLGPQHELGRSAVLVEALYRPGSTTAEAYFVMTRRETEGARGWEYLVVTRDGQIDPPGSQPLCERCHAEAPHDHVFGRAHGGSPQ